MKRGLILLIALLGTAYLGCRQEPGNDIRPKIAQVDNARMPEDGSAIVRTGNREVIKKSGWQLPITLPAEKQYHATTLVYAGRNVTVLNSPFFPEEKPVVRAPKLLEDGEIEYKVSQIIEFTDERKKPYCYQLFVSHDQSDLGNPHSGVPTFISYRDDDGDGIFETLGASCTVPEWVK